MLHVCICDCKAERDQSSLRNPEPFFEEVEEQHVHPGRLVFALQPAVELVDAAQAGDLVGQAGGSEEVVERGAEVVA